MRFAFNVPLGMVLHCPYERVVAVQYALLLAEEQCILHSTSRWGWCMTNMFFRSRCGTLPLGSRHVCCRQQFGPAEAAMAAAASASRWQRLLDNQEMQQVRCDELRWKWLLPESKLRALTK